jgi:biopolymer transport protein ExbD
MSVTIRKGSVLEAQNLTPLIDVVFQLLIFFLVATEFAEEDKEIEFPLPDASTAMPMNAVAATYLNIDRTGRFLMEGNVMDPAEVELALKRLVRGNPVSQKVIINADRKTPLESVVQAIDLCKRARVADFSIGTEGDR